MKQFIRAVRRWKRKVWWFDLGQLTKLLSVPLLIRTVGENENKRSHPAAWLLPAPGYLQPTQQVCGENEISFK